MSANPIKTLRVRCVECDHRFILRKTDVMVDRLKVSALGSVDDLVIGGQCPRCSSHKLASPRAAK